MSVFTRFVIACEFIDELKRYQIWEYMSFYQEMKAELY